MPDMNLIGRKNHGIIVTGRTSPALGDLEMYVKFLVRLGPAVLRSLHFKSIPCLAWEKQDISHIRPSLHSKNLFNDLEEFSLLKFKLDYCD